MIEKLLELIEYSSENALLDFKQQEYSIEAHPKKHEIIKDISAMANHPSNEDKFIIVGIEEIGGQPSKFYDISNPVDEAKYQQLIGSCIEPKINFEYKHLKYKEFNLMYFRIYDNNDRPYLLKKNIQNYSDSKKNEFREGDGFIRVGTSTKKIIRENLEKIYKNKFKEYHRKSDVNVIPYLKRTTEGELANLHIRFLDFDIENLSTKSLEIDFEVKIFKNDNFKLLEKSEIEYEPQKEMQKKDQSSFAPISYYPIIKDVNLFINLEELPQYYIIRRNKSRFTKTDFRIAQNDIESSVFAENIFVLGKLEEIKCEVYIRSDDFIGGMLTKQLLIK